MRGGALDGCVELRNWGRQYTLPFPCSAQFYIAAVQAGRRLLQGAPYRYTLMAYCSGSPLQDKIDMVLTDTSGDVIWRLQGKCTTATQQHLLLLQGIPKNLREGGSALVKDDNLNHQVELSSIVYDVYVSTLPGWTN